MKKRSRAGGEPIKGRRRKAPAPKRHNAPKPAVLSNPPAGEMEVRPPERGRDEAVEQLSAAADVLKVITSSPGDLKRVFEAILENATRLCEAKFGALWLREGDVFRIGAGHLPSSADIAIYQTGMTFALHENPNVPIARMVETKAVLHIVDLRTDQSYIERSSRIVPLVETVGARTFLGVPMLKNNDLVGAFVICRTEVRPFTEKQIVLVQNFAAQAVIAIENARLLNELRQRTSDLTESLEQQTATSEILQVISSSPVHLQPVFDALLANATRLCEASYGAMWLREEDKLRIVASYGTLPEAYLEQWRTGTVSLIDPNLPGARAIRSTRPVQVDDLLKEPAYLAGHPLAVSAAEIAGIRTFVIVPMFKESDPVGNIVIYRKEVRPFTEKQIALTNVSVIVGNGLCGTWSAWMLGVALTTQ
jgi:GAF domain-containing protein